MNREVIVSVCRLVGRSNNDRIPYRFGSGVVSPWFRPLEITIL